MTPAVQPIIFVDVDGVLVIGRPVRVPRPVGMRANGTTYRRPPRHAGFVRSFAQPAVDALNDMATSTGAAFVMSSSWRLRPDARECVCNAGVVDRWHTDWSTDQLDGGRGAQITRWLAAHGRPPHVILDDWVGELDAHAGRVVQVPFRRGITLDHVAAARAILADQDPATDRPSAAHDCCADGVD